MTESRSDNPGRGGNSWQFLGVDLSQWPRLWLEGWRIALASRWLGRIVPQEPVDVILPTGECRRYLAGDWSDCTAAPSRYRAVLLDRADVLTRSLTLPPLSGDDLVRAVAFEVEGLTPFGIDHTAWGYRQSEGRQPGAATGGIVLEVALARQADVAARLAAAQGVTQGSHDQADYEVWALDQAERPIVLRGFAEQRRAGRRTRRLLQIGALAVGVLFLSLAALSIPAIEAQSRLSEATAAYEKLQTQARDVQAARSRLIALSETALAVSERLSAAPTPIRLVDRLSALLPESAYLEQLTMNERHARVTGQSDNASALLQSLGAKPGFQNVRAPTAFTRSRATGKDRFVIEFDYHPEIAAAEAQP